MGAFEDYRQGDTQIKGNKLILGSSDLVEAVSKEVEEYP